MLNLSPLRLSFSHTFSFAASVELSFMLGCSRDLFRGVSNREEDLDVYLCGLNRFLE